MPLNKTISNFVFNNYSSDPAKTLLHLGTVGLALSCFAQLFMIVTNKDIKNKEKKFLIPQEAIDGVVNVGLTYTITAFIKKQINKFVESGKVITPKMETAIRNFRKGHTISYDSHISAATRDLLAEKIIKNPKLTKNSSTTEYLKGIIEFLELLGDDSLNKNTHKIFQDSVENFTTSTQRTELIKQYKKALEDFTIFRSSVGVAATIGASVLAASIITPFVRNAIANNFQKQKLQQEKPVKQVNYPKLLLKPQIPGVFSPITRI